MFSYEEVLSVSASDFFNTLLSQVVHDINDQTGRNLDNTSILSGCRYKVKKKYGKKIVESIVEVKKPVVNKKIETAFESNGKKYSMIYEIEAIDDDNCKVRYIQNDGKEKTGIFTSMRAKSTTKKRFKAFVKFIKDSKK